MNDKNLCCMNCVNFTEHEDVEEDYAYCLLYNAVIPQIPTLVCTDIILEARA